MHTNCATCEKSKHRTCEEKNNIIKRLNVIEGQIRGVKQMVSEDRYCDEIIIQISAITHSLQSLGSNILKSHLKTCVIEDIKEGKIEVIDDVINLFDKLK